MCFVYSHSFAKSNIIHNILTRKKVFTVCQYLTILQEVEFILVLCLTWVVSFFFFFQAEDGIRDSSVTGVQTCALPILKEAEAGGGGRAAEIERARKAWSQGFVAEAIDKFCRTQEVMDVSGKPNKGVLAGHDMAKWQATVEAPLTYDYGRYTVCKAGPWTPSPVVLQQLALLKGFNLDSMNPTSPDFIHLQVECLQLAYADREAFYGDPAFVALPMN